MKITSLEIEHWRSLRDISLTPGADNSLVCLVGQNGSGKSTILELVAALSNRVNISAGYELSRGSVFEEPHKFTAEIRFDESEIAAIGLETNVTWNGTLTLGSRKESVDPKERASVEIVAQVDGQPDSGSTVGRTVRTLLGQLRDTYHLYLDAERSYPKAPIDAHLLGRALTQDWESKELRRDQAYHRSTTQYQVWFQYMLSREGQSAARERRARRLSEAISPGDVDPFREFSRRLNAVLPYLVFSGVDHEKHGLMFRAGHVEVDFHNLSSGEREITYVLGQIDRFQLERGFLLIDEPERHLNHDLLRRWLSFLRNTFSAGQFWVATHALDVSEVAGADQTFLLEIDSTTRRVSGGKSLRDRPAHRVLTTILGTPGFSASRFPILYVEGEATEGASIRQREIFRELLLPNEAVRFIEGGGCEGVIRSVRVLRDFSVEHEGAFLVGGIVDRDFRTLAETNELRDDAGVHVLECHEVENLFLHPESLAVAANEPTAVVRTRLADASDAGAGKWLLQYTLHRTSAGKALAPEVLRRLRAKFGDVRWSDDIDVQTLQQSLNGLAASEGCDFAFGPAVSAYQRIRDDPDSLWMRCCGKEVLSRLARPLGFVSPTPIIRRILSAWASEFVPRPQVVVGVREYVRSVASSAANVARP